MPSSSHWMKIHLDRTRVPGTDALAEQHGSLLGQCVLALIHLLAQVRDRVPLGEELLHRNRIDLPLSGDGQRHIRLGVSTGGELAPYRGARRGTVRRRHQFCPNS